MRRLFVLALAASLAGCAYVNSFKGRPGQDPEPTLATRTGFYTTPRGQMETVTVRVVDSESPTHWCWNSAGGVDCTFSTAYLRDFAVPAQGGWMGLIGPSARQICADAMWTLGPYVGGRDAERECGQALLEMRFRELAPPPAGPR